MKLPSLRAIQAFDAVGRHSSFSRAADELAVTHGAVSQQIRGLEQQIGTRLFRRTAAGAELTQTTTPPKVVITEYVDVARAFFPDGKEPKFVNAVLDHMAHEAKPEAF